MDPLMDNYLALYLCIEKEYSSDKALSAIGIIQERKVEDRRDETEEMIKLKKTMTYEEIGKLFGVSRHAVFYRIKRAKGAKVS